MKYRDLPLLLRFKCPDLISYDTLTKRSETNATVGATDRGMDPEQNITPCPDQLPLSMDEIQRRVRANGGKLHVVVMASLEDLTKGYNGILRMLERTALPRDPLNREWRLGQITYRIAGTWEVCGDQLARVLLLCEADLKYLRPALTPTDDHVVTLVNKYGVPEYAASVSSIDEAKLLAEGFLSYYGDEPPSEEQMDRLRAPGIVHFGERTLSIVPLYKGHVIEPCKTSSPATTS